MKKRNPVVYLIFVPVLLIISCSGKIKKESSDAKDISLLSTKWKSDSLGCLKVRTKELAEFILNSSETDQISESDFLNLFGSPNVVTWQEEKIILGYYFDSACKNEKVDKSSHFCVAEYTFTNEHLLQRNFKCN